MHLLVAVRVVPKVLSKGPTAETLVGGWSQGANAALSAAFLCSAYGYDFRAIFQMDARRLYHRSLVQGCELASSMANLGTRFRNHLANIEFVCALDDWLAALPSDAVMDKWRAIYTITSECVLYPETSHLSIGTTFAADIAHRMRGARSKVGK